MFMLQWPISVRLDRNQMKSMKRPGKNGEKYVHTEKERQRERERRKREVERRKEIERLRIIG